MGRDGGVMSHPAVIGVAVAAVPLLAVAALLGLGSTGGNTFNGSWTRHINRTRSAFRRRSGGGRSGSPPLGGGGGGGGGGEARHGKFSRLL